MVKRLRDKIKSKKGTRDKDYENILIPGFLLKVITL